MFIGGTMSNNPRYENYAARQKLRARLLHNTEVCALCGKPIDKTLKTPHPMSAEVDEIIPISKGGSPIAPDNCQLVHRICNQRKGNKTNTTVSTVRRVIEQPLPTSRDW